MSQSPTSEPRQRSLLLSLALSLAAVLVVVLVIGGCATKPVQQSIEAACEALVLDYAFYRDREDLEVASQGVAALFTEDATLRVNGQSFAGRKAIFERIVRQTNPPQTAHMMSTIRIFPQSPSRATGVSYATVYIAPKPNSAGVTPKGFTAVGEYQDEFVLTPQGWRIAKRTFVERLRYPETGPRGKTQG